MILTLNLNFCGLRLYETGPTKIIGPVGAGIPPAGSSVTAKAFAAVPGGTLAMIEFISPFTGLKTPALIGAPFIGTSHSW